MLVNELTGLIIARYKTRGNFAKAMCISPKTLATKLKRGVFGSDEIEKMIDLLEIDDPARIFFTNEVTREVTRESRSVD